MNTREALRTVAHGSDLFANQLGQEAFDQLTADARALWAVRVLDAWASQKGLGVRKWSNSSFVSTYEQSGELIAAGITCELTGRDSFRGATRDAARIAAALAVFPELPADVRAELGECP